MTAASPSTSTLPPPSSRRVGARSKHHDGWCNWPSATAYNWNSVDVGPKRDLVGEVADATRAAGMVFGVYHSLYEW